MAIRYVNKRILFKFFYHTAPYLSVVFRTRFFWDMLYEVMTSNINFNARQILQVFVIALCGFSQPAQSKVGLQNYLKKMVLRLYQFTYLETYLWKLFLSFANDKKMMWQWYTQVRGKLFKAPSSILAPHGTFWGRFF